MAWFGAKLLFKHLDTTGKTDCFEESVRLIQAKDFAAAERKAHSLGKNEEQDGVDDGVPGPQSLSQRFVAVLDVYDMGASPGGDVEVYSTIMNLDEAKLLLEIYPPEDDDAGV
jgi:hypothetical protein